MGVMTISLKKEDEEALRKLAKLKYGDTKGAIAKVISEAIRKELAEREKREHYREAMRVLDKGVDLKGWKYTSRDEFYD
jgi:hypothetical protein